jgi:NDP-sugar pyrophosphorylase family protein
MNFAIIAAGEGSRLAKEGISGPKPMVKLHEEMLIDRLIRVFLNNNAESIRIIINEDSPLLEAHLKQFKNVPVQIIKKSTPSSLHSFHEILNTCSNLDSICLTTTDTVFHEKEFQAYIDAFNKSEDMDGMMAVTTFIDDESPLYVDVNDSMQITAFMDHNDTHTPYISGGIYCLKNKAFQVAHAAVQGGTSRMRNFQRQLLTANLKLEAFTFSKIVDVDHVQDIATAEAFLETEASFVAVEL